MKNKMTILMSLSLVLFIALGCSFGGLIGGSDTEETSKSDTKDSTSTASEKKKEAEPSGEVVKVGIAECDELATYINDNSEEIEGSIIVKGIVEVYKQTFLKNLRDSVDKMSEEEKKKFAEVCSKSLENLKKSMNK